MLALHHAGCVRQAWPAAEGVSVGLESIGDAVASSSSHLFCDGYLLVRHGSLIAAEAAGVLPVLSETRTVLDSYAVPPHGNLAVAVSGSVEQAPDGFEWIRIRRLVAAESPEAAAACRALGLLNWRARNRFCGCCGGPLHDHPTETARQCAGCGHIQYPCISPAVIVRVERENQILLARHVQRNQEVYTCIAGYLEAGESMEDAVRREVAEEVGIEVDHIRYVGSQYWPFPNQLMLACTARWKSGVIRLQADEISDARWFDPGNLPTVPPPGSVSHRLIYGLFHTSP